ncbi:hypothetical protein RI054_16g75750 [Pseudoscourfieldia marina]
MNSLPAVAVPPGSPREEVSRHDVPQEVSRREVPRHVSPYERPKWFDVYNNDPFYMPEGGKLGAVFRTEVKADAKKERKQGTGGYIHNDMYHFAFEYLLEQNLLAQQLELLDDEQLDVALRNVFDEGGGAPTSARDGGAPTGGAGGADAGGADAGDGGEEDGAAGDSALADGGVGGGAA